MKAVYVAAALLCAAAFAPAFAGEREVKSIIKDLKPIFSKGLQPTPAKIKVLRIQGLASSRAVAKQLVEEVDAPAEEVDHPTDEYRPHVDMQINFDFNEAKVRADQLPKLKDLGEALTSKALAKNRFAVNGHTDTVGVPDYNQKLSLRRAAAISVWLMENFGAGSGKEFPLSEERLEVRGFGESCPKDAPGKDDYKSDTNRRAEIETLPGAAR